MRDAELLLQDAADPHIAGWLQGGAADALADQVLRFGDPCLRIDEHIAVPELAKQEDRNGGDRHALFARDQIGRHIQFADVERQVAHHAAVALRVGEFGDEHQVDALRLHLSVHQRPDVVEVVTRDGQWDAACHVRPQCSGCCCGSKRILPIVPRLSIARCASAAFSSGNLRSIRGTSAPSASQRKTSSARCRRSSGVAA